MEKDHIIKEMKIALDVALLKHSKMSAVASDKKKMLCAFGFLVVAAVASGLGMKFFGVGSWIKPTWGYTLGMMVYQVISAVVGIYILSIVAKAIFKGQAKHDAFFRVIAFGSIVTWLAIFPPLSIVGGIWALVILFVALKVIHKLTTGGAIGTIIVTIIAMAIVMAVLSPVLGALGIGNFGYGSMGMRGDGMFKMDIDVPNGEGSVEMEGGKMSIKGPDGEEMEITIPNYN